MTAQPGVAELDTLVCDGKTLRGSIAETDSGAAKFIAQVSLYAKSLGVAIAQTTDATDASGEIQALRQLLEAVELDGILVQADALHANRPFSSTSGLLKNKSRLSPTPAQGQGGRQLENLGMHRLAIRLSQGSRCF
jgi:hypothetical protein